MTVWTIIYRGRVIDDSQSILYRGRVIDNSLDHSLLDGSLNDSL